MYYIFVTDNERDRMLNLNKFSLDRYIKSHWVTHAATRVVGWDHAVDACTELT